MSQYDRNQTPEQIEDEIERTRADMGEKIDKISERVSPEQLKYQAKETVNDVLTESANTISDYVRTNRQEIVSSFGDTVKRNPIPTALIGVGIAWLAVETFRTPEYESDRYVNRRERDYRYGYSPYAVRGVPGAVYDDEYSDGHSVSEDLRDKASSGWDSATDAAQHQAERIGEQVRNKTDETGREIRSSVEEAGQQAAEGARQAGDKVSDMAASANQQVQQVGEQINNYAHQVGEQIGSQAQQVGDAVGRQISDVQDQTSQLSARYQREAQQQIRNAGRQMERSLEENPLVYSALALGAGLAIGLLLPQTRVENRIMGETSDQVMESAQTVAQESARRAQRVVEDVKPELEQTAQRVADDLADAGRQAVEDIKHSGNEAKEDLSSAADTAKEKAKAEGKELTETAKAEAEKVADTATSNKPSTGSAPKNDKTPSKDPTTNYPKR